MDNFNQLDLKEKWINIITIHNATKELYILAEEYSEDLKMFIQPIKELRDAYEHIIRVQDKMYSTQILNDDDIKYIETNIDKTLGHEYRAFFDTIDFLSIIFRKKIGDVLSLYSYQDIISVYKDYGNIAIRLVEIPELIAQCRIKKDVGNMSKLTNIISEYKSIVIDELLEYYKITIKEILPALH